MKALIESWRKVWGQGDFPFYFVQLPDWPGRRGGPRKGPAGGNRWSHIREQQTRTWASVPNTGMIVTTDIGATDIHPPNKFDVGLRLARWALARDYGQKDLEVSGPIYREMKVEGDKIRIFFDHADAGLMVGKKKGRAPVVEDPAGTLKWFAIAGADPASPTGSAAAGKKWVWADAVIDGKTVVVSSPKVKAPVAVRYAFRQNPVGANLYNRAGLPASPFRTDTW
jgi:sialate O-acetylesterase